MMGFVSKFVHLTEKEPDKLALDIRNTFWIFSWSTSCTCLTDLVSQNLSNIAAILTNYHECDMRYMISQSNGQYRHDASQKNILTTATHSESKRKNRPKRLWDKPLMIAHDEASMLSVWGWWTDCGMRNLAGLHQSSPECDNSSWFTW